jgi:hypothetical protein
METAEDQTPLEGAAKAWWTQLEVLWDRVASSYLEQVSTQDLDAAELAKLKQKLAQLLLCTKESFTSRYASRFCPPEVQQMETLRLSVSEHESKLRALVREIKDLRSSLIPAVEDAHDQHFNRLRDLLTPAVEAPAVGAPTNPSPPSLPTAELLQTLQNEIDALTTRKSLSFAFAPSVWTEID